MNLLLRLWLFFQKYYFDYKNRFFIFLQCNNIKNRIDIDKHVFLKDCIFKFNGKKNLIKIEKGCILKGLHIYIEGSNNYIEIGESTIVNASKNCPTIMNALEGTFIKIGSNCLLSNNIELHTSDYHSILNKDNQRINPAKSIIIENHVWIGLKSIILKGTIIKENSIVAAGSLVNHQFNENNILIAGSPASIKKSNISWIKEKI